MGAAKQACEKSLTLMKMRLRTLEERIEANKHDALDYLLQKQINEEREQIEGLEKLLKTMGESK